MAYPAPASPDHVQPSQSRPLPSGYPPAAVTLYYPVANFVGTETERKSLRNYPVAAACTSETIAPGAYVASLPSASDRTQERPSPHRDTLQNLATLPSRIASSAPPPRKTSSPKSSHRPEETPNNYDTRITTEHFKLDGQFAS
ncbi:hypothetical protein PG984_015157 [Apiospora sp. TS-2023a]